MDLTSRAADLFILQPPNEKQRFLRLVLKSASWKGGELRTEFEEPFESLRRSNQLNKSKHDVNGVGKAEVEVWLRSRHYNAGSGTYGMSFAGYTHGIVLQGGYSKDFTCSAGTDTCVSYRAWVIRRFVRVFDLDWHAALASEAQIRYKMGEAMHNPHRR